MLHLAKASRLSHRILSAQSRQAPRLLSTQARKPSSGKPSGDISDAFASLAGKQWTPLDRRFADIKQQLIATDSGAVHASWNRLLKALREEVPIIQSRGSSVIPEIDFKDIDNPSQSFTFEHKKRGVAVIRNVLPEAEALELKDDIRKYVAANPHTRAFPQHNPQVYELYWSPAQLYARSHPNLLKAQSFLMQHFHVARDPTAPLSTTHAVAYADRLRMRQPGDNSFALGPHIDGGSCERWEDAGYGGRAGVYREIFAGNWEAFDPWDAAPRLDVTSDLYAGSGACSAFRMYQGWLSLSTTGPREGTLLVNPLLQLATAYVLLRPFFTPRRGKDEGPQAEFLAPENWQLCDVGDSWLQGATPGHGQELRDALHPHLGLDAGAMVHVPQVRAGDYVAWHCDGVHAVDMVHEGRADSSVLYIPACPLTEGNAAYLARQRACFVDGVPSPDFPGGAGESAHVGRWGPEELARVSGSHGMRAMGLEAWDADEEGLSKGQREVLDRANAILGFYRNEI